MYSDMTKCWLGLLYRREIFDTKEQIRNERIWECGYDGDAPNPHTTHIEDLEEYIETLNDLLVLVDD